MLFSVGKIERGLLDFCQKLTDSFQCECQQMLLQIVPLPMQNDASKSDKISEVKMELINKIHRKVKRMFSHIQDWESFIM